VEIEVHNPVAFPSGRSISFSTEKNCCRWLSIMPFFILRFDWDEIRLTMTRRRVGTHPDRRSWQNSARTSASTIPTPTDWLGRRAWPTKLHSGRRPLLPKMKSITKKQTKNKETQSRDVNKENNCRFNDLDQLLEL